MGHGIIVLVPARPSTSATIRALSMGRFSPGYSAGHCQYRRACKNEETQTAQTVRRGRVGVGFVAAAAVVVLAVVVWSPRRLLPLQRLHPINPPAGTIHQRARTLARAIGAKKRPHGPICAQSSDRMRRRRVSLHHAGCTAQSNTTYSCRKICTMCSTWPSCLGSARKRCEVVFVLA